MQVRNRHTDVEIRLVDTLGEEGGVTERGALTYTLLCVKQIAGGKLLCNTGSSAQCSMTT